MNDIHKVLEHSYKNVGMFQIYSEIFEFSKFFKELNCKNVLEIGSYYGGTFFVLCKLSKFEGKKISIDYPFYDGQADQMRQRNTQAHMRTFADNVHIITGDSHADSTLDSLKTILNGEELDFIFIDGDHSYEGVKKDFEMYTPFLKEGGYVGFHDVNDTTRLRELGCYVGRFWNELQSDKKIEFNTHGTAMGIGVARINKYKKPLNMKVAFDASGKIAIQNLNFSNLDVLVSIRDRDTKIPISHTSLQFSNENNQFLVDPAINHDFASDANFSGFLIEFFDKNKNLIDSKDLKIKDRHTPVPVLTRNYQPFDSLFIQFKRLFYDKVYDGLDLKNVKTVIDVGANAGLFSNYISWKDDVRLIHLIEPVSFSLEESQKQFYYYNHVKCHRMGIHYFDGKSKIYVNENCSALSNFLKESDADLKTEEVEVKTLPNFMNHIGLQRVDLIKIDIGGMEYEIFNAMSDSEISRAINWIVEYRMNDDGKAEILQERFKSMGYTVSNFPDKNVATKGFFFAKK
jgi:hypothetical protein